ncbi:hypothetical protein [Halolamina salina]|uniref:Uncharacterized protein n=1 Tax=Halolamina salina TaxID=1220023 RepID=A0ABD6BA51_9EURY
MIRDRLRPRASARQLVAAAGLPLIAQSVLFQIALAGGEFYEEPNGSVYQNPDGAGWGTTYYDYGFFGPYWTLDLALVASVGVAVIVSILAILAVEYRVRRGAGVDDSADPAGAAA